jgi:hypothetical protein
MPIVIVDMALGTSLVIDTGDGEQFVRRPRATDPIGAALRDAFGRPSPVPADLQRLLALLDRRRPRR